MCPIFFQYIYTRIRVFYVYTYTYDYSYIYIFYFYINNWTHWTHITIYIRSYLLFARVRLACPGVFGVSNYYTISKFINV